MESVSIEEKCNSEPVIDLDSENLMHKLNNAGNISLYMKEYVKNNVSSKQEQVKHLISVLAPAKLKFRFEILNDRSDSDNGFQKKPEYETGIDQAENAHEEDNSTEFTILDNPNVKIGRLIISKIRSKSNFDYEITFAANGIIFDTDNWNVIVSSSYAFNPNINKKSIIDNFSNYKIYKLRDGTTINIYYYGDSWCISTLNGYEVNNYRWMGRKTYIEALMEAMCGLDRKIPRNKVPSPEEAFRNLKKENCYTLGFRHPDFHPFSADSAGVWLIQGFNRETLELVDVSHTGINQQIEVSAGDIISREIYPGKDDADYYRRVFAEIVHKNKSAYDVFKASNSNARKRINPIDSSFNINYGFILRGPFDTCGSYSNISLESVLYSKIRQFIYNQPYVQSADKIGVDHSNRLNYSILRAYLNYPVRNVFITLFPQFDSDYNDCKNVIATISDKILKLARYGNTGNNIMSARPQSHKNVLYDSVAEKLFAHIKSNDSHFGKGGRYDHNIKKIIADYVCNAAYTDVYFMIMKSVDDNERGDVD